MMKKGPNGLEELPVKTADRFSGTIFSVPLEDARLTVRNRLGMDESIETVVERLRPVFDAARRKILRETFIEQLRRPEMPGRITQPEADERQPLIFTEADVEAFIAQADDEGLLSSTLFDEVLVPQLRAVTHEAPVEFFQCMVTAIACLPHLAELDTSGATHARTNPLVYSSFFREGGTFEIFMSQFGRDAALAAAAFQGGGEHLSKKASNEPWEDDALIAAIAPSLELLDEAQYPLFFQAFRGQCVRSRKYGEEFLAQVPALLTELKAKSSPYISLWLTLAATGSHSYQKELFEVESCVADMEAIAAWEAQQPGALEFFLFYLRDVHPHGGGGAVHFVKERDGFFYHYVPEIIEHLMEAGYTKDRLTEVLGLFKTIKEMEPRHVLSIIEHHPKLESNFPGGIEALRAYASRIADCSSGISRLISTCEHGSLPTEHLDEYLETGVEAVRVLKNSASGYFSRHSDHVQLLEMDPEKYKERVQRITTLAGSLKHLRTFYNSHPSTHLFRSGLGHLYLSDEKFDAFCRGAEMMIADFSETSADAGDGYCDRLIDYVYPQGIFYNSNESPNGADLKAFEDSIDWGLHADELLRNNGNLKEGLYRITAFSRQRKGFISGARLARTLHQEGATESQLTELQQWVSRASALNDEIVQCRNLDLPRAEVFRLRQAWIAKYEALLVEHSTLPHGELVIPESMEALRRKIDDLIQTLLFRGFICAILEPQTRVQSSPFLRQAHGGTQAAVMGGTLLYALGLEHDPLINPELRRMELPIQDRALMDASNPGVSDDLIDGPFGNELRRRIALMAPRVEGQILAERASGAGASYVGGKGYTQLAIPTDRLDYVRSLFGLDAGTPFSLMHHNSVRLPPSPTALEMSYMVKLFGLLGIPFDSLQVCAPGHWPEEVCRLVAATYLLGTSDCPTYAPNAFATTHDSLTGHRLLVRGAGVVDRTVPFFLPGIPETEDRTDVLGRIGTDDFALDQWVGTLVPHALYGGRFAAAGQEWLGKMHDLVTRHGLRDSLESTTWILQHATGVIDPPEHHAAVIRGFTDLWRAEVRQPNLGLVGEVQSLLGEGATAIRSQRNAVQLEESDAFKRMMLW